MSGHNHIRAPNAVCAALLLMMLSQTTACVHDAPAVEDRGIARAASNPIARIKANTVVSVTAEPILVNGTWVVLQGADKFVLHNSGPAGVLRPTEVCRLQHEDAIALVMTLAKADSPAPAGEVTKPSYLVRISMSDGARQSVVIPVLIDGGQPTSIAVGDTQYALNHGDTEVVETILWKASCT